MNYCHFAIACFLVVSSACTTAAQGTNTNSWHPNTRKLDLGAKLHSAPLMDAGSTLQRDVKYFYESLRDKQWHETYELRAKAFREDVPEAYYLAEAKKYESHWGLVNYDVLSVAFNQDYGTTNADQAILICRFIELPDYTESYSTVFWHYEDGGWKCLSAGPNKLGIFLGTRPATIDWK